MKCKYCKCVNCKYSWGQADVSLLEGSKDAPYEQYSLPGSLGLNSF